MSSVDMSPASAERENVEYLAEFLDIYYADEIARIATGEKGGRKLHVDMADLQLFLDTDAYRKLRGAIPKYLRQLNKAIEFVDSTRGVTNNIDVSVVDETGADIEHLSVSDVNSDFVSDYIGVSGQLSAVTKVRSFPQVAQFACKKCGTPVEVPQNTKEFEEPRTACECESAPQWALDYKNTQWEDHRKLKIQEPPNEASNGDSQFIAVHMFGRNTKDEYGNALTERVGEDVTVYGTVELIQQSGRNADEFLFEHYLSGEAITFEETGVQAVDVESHREEVHEHANADDVYERFYKSIAPQIHPTPTMELAMKVCAAFLFAAPRVDPEGGAMYRGDIHAALIGDPGMAKSVLLKGVADFSPDCEHRSATGLSSDVGLVAAAVEDDFDSGGWTLKPGILVRAGMHAIVDEIDKGPDKLEKINDALEGRQIASIDKAGMKADLKTRTGFLASGNPEGSRFDTDVPLPNQINVDESLLTRFDAIVLLVDKVDESQDRKIAEHITGSYMEGVELMKDADTEIDKSKRQVSQEVAQAWVTLGRRIVPTLTEEASQKLEDFYVEVRGFNDDERTISATARQLEGGIRFAMAFARMRLSETVEAQDVDMAIDVSKSLIGQTHDGNGNFAIDQLTVKTKDHAPTTQDDKMNAIKDAANGKTLSEIAKETSIDKYEVDERITKLKRKGELYEPEQGVFRST